MRILMLFLTLLLTLAVSTTNLESSEQRFFYATASYTIKFRVVSSDRAASSDNVDKVDNVLKISSDADQN